MEIYDVVKKLTGEIEPVGETTEDNRRFENLETMIKLAKAIHHDIDYLADEYRDSHAFSLKRAGELANKYLDDLGIPRE